MSTQNALDRLAQLDASLDARSLALQKVLNERRGHHDALTAHQPAGAAALLEEALRRQCEVVAGLLSDDVDRSAASILGRRAAEAAAPIPRAAEDVFDVETRVVTPR